MKRTLVLTIGLMLLLACLASAADLTGKWEGSFKYNDQAVPVTVDLKGGTEISGTVSAANADGSGGAVTVRGTNIIVSGAIDASASAANAKGGDISLIATADTKATGKIKAVGGVGGQGGAIETSGNTLSFDGASVEAGRRTQVDVGSVCGG